MGDIAPKPKQPKPIMKVYTITFSSFTTDDFALYTETKVAATMVDAQEVFDQYAEDIYESIAEDKEDTFEEFKAARCADYNLLAADLYTNTDFSIKIEEHEI